MRHPAVPVLLVAAAAFAAPLAAFAPLAAAPPQAPAAQDAPIFEARDVDKLRCRVVSVENRDASTTVLEVVVSNRSDLTAEPLRFRIEDGKRRRGRNAPAPAAQQFERARLPLVGRFGEGIAPGKSRRYVVQAYLPDSKRPQVTVEQANFHRGAPPRDKQPQPVVEDLRPTRGTNQFLGQTFDTASFSIHNPLPRAADVWLRADYVRPVKDQLLLAYRVPAGQTRRVQLGVLPNVRCFDDSDTAFATDVELADVQVVDWIEIAPIDHDDARRAFLDSYATWHRWPDTLRQATAKFRTTEVGVDRHGKRDVKLRISGTLTVGADHRLTVELDDRSSARLRKLSADNDGFSWSSGGFLQRQATRHLRRRSVADVERDNELKWIEAQTVQLFGPTFYVDSSGSWTRGADGYSSQAPRFALDNGRITRSGYGYNETNDHVWTTAKLGQGWVLEQELDEPMHSTRARRETWKHALRDGIAVPTEYHLVVTNDGEPEEDQRVEFSDWQLDLAPQGAAANAGPVAAAGPPPTGAGAEQLAQAWSRLYRFPRERTQWTAKLRVQTNGTDLSWQGHDDFTAKFTRVGVGTDRPEIQLDLRGAVSQQVEADLASVYFDRLGIWFGSDPQSMGAFDEAFAGATISKRNAGGWHRLQDHPIAEVRVQDGLVREFKFATGLHRRFHYETFEGTELITRIERDVKRGTETRIRPARLGTWIVPTRYEFVRIFGDDWGPEIFALSELRFVD